MTYFGSQETALLLLSVPWGMLGTGQGQTALSVAAGHKTPLCYEADKLSCHYTFATSTCLGLSNSIEAFVCKNDCVRSSMQSEGFKILI